MKMKRRSKQLTELSLYLMSLSNETGKRLEHEYYFAKPRQWRFDFAFPAMRLAIEYEGGLYREKFCHVCRAKQKGAGGYHQSVGRMQTDMEKYNNAALLGWRVLRVCAKTADTGKAYEEIDLAIFGKVKNE